MEYEDKEKLAKFITEDYPEIRMLINAGHYEEMWEYVFDMERYENKANVFRLLCALDELNIKHGLTSIPKSYFRNCSMPSKLVIPSCITTIGPYAFAYIEDVKEVIIPDSITNEPNGLSQFCFSGGEYTKIKFPNNLKNIPAGCCLYSSLKTVKIPNSVEGIGEEAFSTTNLTSITIPPSVLYIHDGAFSYSKLKKIVIPDTVQKIGTSVFSGCKSLTSITLPEKFRKSVKRMGLTKKQIETINWV